MSTYKAILTTLGLTRLADAQSSGTPLVFTHLAVGDGDGSPITPDASMTALVNETARVEVNNVDIMPGAPTTVRVEGLIPAETGGFTIREAGLFNAAGELLAVASYPDIYKPVPADGASVEEYIRVLITYANVEDIALTVDTSVVMATRLYVDEKDDELEEALKVYTDNRVGMGFFGDGSDGDAELDGTNEVDWASKASSVYTMSRDCFCDDLTLTGGAELKANGFRIYVRGTLKTEDGSKITANGTSATTRTGASASATGTVLGGGQGGNGGDGSGEAQNGFVPAFGPVESFGGGGGAGGASGGATPGGTAISTSPLAAELGSPHVFGAPTSGYVAGLSAGAATLTALSGGYGGSGGGASGSGGSGGGGGGGGGVLVVAARMFELESAGDLTAAGGDGAPGGSGGASGSGGGGGGGGGVVIFAYVKKNEGVTFSASVNAPGGNGGAGGGAGTAGEDGEDGALFEHHLYPVGEDALESDEEHVESGWSAITEGSGDTHDYLDVTFDDPFDAATGPNGYNVEVSVYSYYGDIITWTLANKLTNGFRLLFSASFDGEVRWRAYP